MNLRKSAGNDSETLSVHIRPKDWIALISILIFHTSVIVSAWWSLSDRVLTLEITMLGNREINAQNQTLIKELSDHQKQVVEIIKKLEEKP